MPTGAVIGSGAQFWLDNASGTLTKLAEVLSVSTPNPQAAEVEATHFESPNRRREYIAGLIEDGEGEFQFNYVPGGAVDTLVQAALADRVVRSYKIVLPADTEGATWEITGECLVRGWERDIPIDDRMTATLTVRFTGASTEAAGA